MHGAGGFKIGLRFRLHYISQKRRFKHPLVRVINISGKAIEIREARRMTNCGRQFRRRRWDSGILKNTQTADR